MTDRATNTPVQPGGSAAGGGSTGSAWRTPGGNRGSGWRTVSPDADAPRSEEAVAEPPVDTGTGETAEPLTNADSIGDPDRTIADAAAERRASEWRVVSSAPARAGAGRAAPTAADVRATATWRQAAASAGRDLAEQPANEGAWYRPTNAVAVVTPVPVVEPAGDEAPAAEAAAPETIIPHDEAETASPADGEAVAEAQTADQTADQPQAGVLPFEGEAAPAQTATAATTPDERAAASTADEDEDDADAYSMSELIALASLVEQAEGLRGGTGATGTAAPAATGTQPPAEVTAEDENDPAAYARRELERLQRVAAEGASELEAVQTGVPAIDPAAVSPGDTAAGTDTGAAPAAEEDPAAVARRELERLQAEGSAAAQPTAQPEAQQPSAAQPAATGGTGIAPVILDARAEAAAMRTELARLPAAEQVLAGKYLQTVEGVLALRERQQAGELDEAAFQQQARALLVNDGTSWWMFGPSRDQWFRYDQAANQWLEETPDEIARLRQLIQGGSANVGEAAPNLGGTVATPTIQQYVSAPLPRQVPVSDPDYTVVGTSAIYLDQDGRSGEQTVPVSALTGATVAGTTVPAASQFEATVPSPALGGATIPSAVPATDITTAPEYAAEAVPSPSFEDARIRQQRRTISTVLIAAALLIGAIFLIGAIIIIGAVLQYRNIAEPFQPQIAALANYQPAFQTARILAADGSLIAELVGSGNEARDEVSLDEISPYMIHAVVSLENERFYEDPGYDPVAIGRAFLQNLQAGEVESGASTITQQVAQLLVLGDQPGTVTTPERKLQEIVTAAEVAQRYDKNFILQLYLNEIGFGNQVFGVEAAAQFYFDKPALELTLPEAALLASLIPAPSSYNPVVNRQIAFEQMRYAMQRMAEVGCLTFQHGQYDGQQFCVTETEINPQTNPPIAVAIADVERLRYNPRENVRRYPYFVGYIQAQLGQYFDESEVLRRGFVIRTTLVPRIQDASQNALVQGLAGQAATGLNTGAVMVSDPRTGAVYAMVGGPDPNNQDIAGEVNNVFTWQQPGSSIKPVVYATAFEGVSRGGTTSEYLTPGSLLWDVPTTYQTVPAYTPVNFDGQYRGGITARAALAQSINVPAVKVYDFVGADRFRETASRMGLRFLENAQFGLATALGATEVRLYDHVQAYATIANNGLRVLPYGIESITDAEGIAVELPARPQPSQAIQPQIAYLLQSILTDNDARAPQFGANSPLFLPEYAGLVGAKTGTTNDNRDLWTMGFTHNMVVGVWLGRADNGPTTGTTQETAAPIWNAIMRAALQGTRPDPFNPPNGVVSAPVCAATGTLYDAAVQPPCPQVRNEIFVQSQPPPAANQGLVQTVQVNSWTGLRANQYCPENVVARQVVTINDPAAIAYLNSGAGAGQAQQLGIARPISTAPTAECQVGTQLPVARITSPTDNQQIIGTVNIQGIVTANTTGTNAFNRYQIEIASAASPDQFAILAGPYGQQVNNGTLAQFNSTQVANGQYRLRLAAFAGDGGFIYSTPVTIAVNNPLPTATPTPLPTATALPTTPPLIFPTPLPFQTTIPFLEPTPTVFLGA